MKAVNLLPADLKPSKRAGSAPAAQPAPVGALLVLAALAAVVIAAAAYVLAGNGVRDRESRLAAVKAERTAASAQVVRLQEYGTFKQMATDRIGTVKRLAASRFDWEQTLRDLSRAIPSNVTLATMTGTVAPGARAGTGGSSNPLRASIGAPAIEIEGCTSGQDEVARLMARLRAVRGVSRVSLSSSANTRKEQGAATAGADEKPEGCGTEIYPEFKIVMFFEGAAAAAGTGSGSATAPATGTATGTTAAAPAATPAPGAASTPAPGATPAPAASPGAPATASSTSSQETTK